jgi:amino acid permease
MRIQFGSNETVRTIREKYAVHIQNLFRLFVTVLAATIAILGANRFAAVMSLLGAIGGSLLSFIFPSFIHLKLLWRELSWLLIAKDFCLIGLGLLAAGATIGTSLLGL